MKKVFNNPPIREIFRQQIALLQLITIVFCFSSSAFSQQLSVEKIQSHLKKMDTSKVFRSASWGCVLERTSDKKILASINEDKILIPASSLKIAVTYVAWKLIGPTMTFYTDMKYDGTIKDSVLHGNIYIVGGGDPALGSSRFFGGSADTVLQSMVDDIKNSGITRIEGGVIADPDYFDDKLIPGSWSWEDMGNYYGGGVCGLNFNENQFEVVFQAGQKVGEPAKVLRIEPPLQDLVYENEVLTGTQNSGDQVIIYGAPYDQHRIFTGTIPLGSKEFGVKGSLPDPAYEFVRQLNKYLVINGIEVKYPPATTPQLRKKGVKISENRTQMRVLGTQRYSEIIKLTHEKSINLYADCLLKALGKIKNMEGSYSSGIDVVLKFWKDKGLDISNILMKDGSGLSVSNRISPLILTQMMCIIDRDKQAGEYIQTLNRAGESGDLKSLFPQGNCVKKLYAKSGYMKTVRTYTGIIKSDKAEGDLAFAIMVNHSGADNAEIKAALKELMEMFCSCKH